MRSLGVVLASVLALSVACREPAPTTNAAQPPSQPSRHGQPISGAETLPLSAILDAPERYQDQTVVVEGTVRAACQAKGCWMELATAAKEDAPGCRVTFKDYGFFVPRDSAGARARVEAQVKLTTVTRKMVEHWESEGARFPGKLPDGSAREVRLVATGVELRRLPAQRDEVVRSP